MNMKIALKTQLKNLLHQIHVAPSGQIVECVSVCVCVGRMRINVLIFDLIAFSVRSGELCMSCRARRPTRRMRNLIVFQLLQ